MTVAGALRVLNQFHDAPGRRGTPDLHGKHDAFKGRSRTLQAQFIGHIEGAANIDHALFHGDFIQVREPRNLGQQSKSCTDEKIRERGRRAIRPSPFLRLVGLKVKSPDRSLEVNILNDTGNSPKGYLSLVRALSCAFSEFIVLDAHFF